MLSNGFTQNKIQTIWRKSKIIAILKLRKYSAIPKRYRPKYLLCLTYKLFERLILNRISPTVEEHLIKEQAAFRPGKSCTRQLLNLNQHIEDGYQVGKIMGTTFVDLYATYDTVRISKKVYNNTQDSTHCRVTQNLLTNRRFYVVLNNERNRLRNNGLPQSSVLAPTLFNIYTNDQPIPNGTRSFIYADNLCITAQYQSFKQVEEALNILTTYYKMNSLRDKKIAESSVECNRTREDYPPEIPWCNNRYVAQLNTAHTKHKNEGSYPKQPTDKMINFQVESKFRYYPNDSFSIKLLYS